MYILGLSYCYMCAHLTLVLSTTDLCILILRSATASIIFCLNYTNLLVMNMLLGTKAVNTRQFFIIMHTTCLIMYVQLFFRSQQIKTTCTYVLGLTRVQ